MAKIQIGGAGGAPSNGFIKSLRESGRDDYLVGTSCVISDLFLADVDESYPIPAATDSSYEGELLGMLGKVRPDFIHLQNDYEVRAVSRLRDKVEAAGVQHYLPNADTIENCVDKEKSYRIWQAAGIKVAKTRLLHTPEDLRKAFNEYGDTVWVRAIEGAAGRGALPADNYEFAKIWIDRYKGWGEFTASELLTKDTVTWLSIWYHGELVVAQTRRRLSWNFGNRTLSGVTGITGVGETCSDETVDRISLDAILAIDAKPHGIFAVDMTYDSKGIPNPTEINIGRFFTTHYFFTKAGLNLPKIYCDIALDGNFPVLEKRINPLPDGLIWIRGMDVEPVLRTRAELEAMTVKRP
ncbi:MAG: carboxylate--amine ligase [Gammaproteobacteria bacterium]|nr:carboxylate--amine ligase [Gammaproteobacteria bacterium]MBU1776207.1 carboxylate--amine ligase [Gammaproteobacteria bacterium]